MKEKKFYNLGKLNSNDEISFPLFDIKVGERLEKAYEFSYYFPSCCLNPVYIKLEEETPLTGVFFFLSYEGALRKERLSSDPLKITRIKENEENKFILHVLYDKSDPNLDRCQILENTNFIFETKCDDRDYIRHTFNFPVKYTPPISGDITVTRPLSSINANDAILSVFATGCCGDYYEIDVYRSPDRNSGNKTLFQGGFKPTKPFEIIKIENAPSGYYSAHIRSSDRCGEIWVERFVEPYPALNFTLAPLLKKTKCFEPCTERNKDCFELGEGSKKRNAWNITRNGLSDGVVQVNIVNGKGNFYYNWSGPFEYESEAAGLLPLEENQLLQNTAREHSISDSYSKGDLINAASGWYGVTIQDDYGNIESRTVEVTEPPLFSINIDTTDAQLPNTPTGSALVEIDGKTGPYRYIWKVVRYFNNTPISRCQDPDIWTNGHLARIRARQEEPYREDREVVVNAKKEFWTWYCEYIERAIENEKGERRFPFEVFLEELSSDVPPPQERSENWEWAWYYPENDGLYPGIYNLYVFDCTDTLIRKNVVIEQPPTLHSCIDSSDACIHGETGKMRVLIESGTPPFRFKFRPGSEYDVSIDKEPPFIEDFHDFKPGNYTLEIFDETGQKTTDNFIIYEPSEWDVEVVSEEVKLIGSETGFAEIRVVEKNINSWIFSQTFSYRWRALPYANDINDELVFSRSPILDNLSAGEYEVEITPVPILCQEPKKVIVTITEPEPIDFNFLVNCDCCNGTEGVITVFDITGGIKPEPEYVIYWFYNGLLVQAGGNVLNNPFEGDYLVRVEDKEGNFTAKTITVESTQGIDFNITNFSTDPLEYNSREGFFEVEILRDPVEPLYWELEYTDLEGGVYEQIDLNLETISPLSFRVINLRQGFYRIRAIDRCGVEEEEILITEEGNPCFQTEIYTGNDVFVFDNNPIKVEPGEVKDISFTLTLERDVCCTSDSNVPTLDGTAFFDIISPFPTFSFRNENTPESSIINNGKTLRIEEPRTDKTSKQEIRVNLRYNGEETDQTVLIIRGNEPCYGEYVIPLNISDCCPEGCCESETCCPDRFKDCCCTDEVCKSPDHPLFQSCCDCADISRETIALFCTKPEKYQTWDVFQRCCDCAQNIIYKDWVCEDRNNENYIDCCPCNELSQQEINETICSDPDHPQLRDCCNCREHRELRNKVCLESGPDDPLYDVCCPCESVKDIVCNDPSHPRFIECCDPCPEDCCAKGTCPDIELCCGCDDFPADEICGNPDHPLYQRCCATDCCGEDNQIEIENARVEFQRNEYIPGVLGNASILDPLSSKVQKGKLIFDYNPSCCGDNRPNPSLLQQDLGFRLAPNQEIPFGKGNNQIIRDFSLDIEYQKVSDLVANQFLNNQKIDLGLSLGCCQSAITNLAPVSVPVCCGKTESTSNITALPCEPKYDVRRYQMGRNPGRVVLIFNNQYGPDSFRIRYNGRLVSKLPDAANTIVANQYIDNLYRIWTNASESQRQQLRNAQILTDTGTASGSAVPVFGDNNYYNVFQTTQERLPDDSRSWLGRQRDRVGGIGRMGFDYVPNPEGPFEIEVEILSYTYVNYFSVYCPGQYQKVEPFIGNERNMTPCGLDQIDTDLYTEEYLTKAKHYTYLDTIDCQDKSIIVPNTGNLNDAYEGWQRWDRSAHEFSLKCCGICSSEFYEGGSDTPINPNAPLYKYYNPSRPCIGRISESDCLKTNGYDLYGDNKNRQMYRDIRWAGQKMASWSSNKSASGSNFTPCKNRGVNLKFFYGEYDFGVDYPDINGEFFDYSS